MGFREPSEPLASQMASPWLGCCIPCSAPLSEYPLSPQARYRYRPLRAGEVRWDNWDGEYETGAIELGRVRPADAEAVHVIGDANRKRIRGRERREGLFNGELRRFSDNRNW